MAILGWTTLIVCVVVLLLRVPDAIQGRNRTVFAILVLATLSSLLRIPGPYEAIDQVLGGWDVTDLLRRYVVFAAILLIGLRVTTGLTADRGHRLIAGPAGRWALALSCLVLTMSFLLIDTRASGGLLAAANGGGPGAALVHVYAAAAHSYPVFVSLVLMPPLLAIVRSRLPRLVRAGSLLMFAGAVAAVARLPVTFAPQEWATGQGALNYAAVLGYVLGLTAFWFSGLIAQPRRSPQAGPHRNRAPRGRLRRNRLRSNRLHPNCG